MSIALARSASKRSKTEPPADRRVREQQSTDPPTESTALLPVLEGFILHAVSGWGQRVGRLQFQPALEHQPAWVFQYRGSFHIGGDRHSIKERIFWAMAPDATRAMVSRADDRPPPSWLR